MKKDEIAVFSFDPEKKDYITRSMLDKLLREIKTNLSKNIPITVVLTETINNV
jgi:TolB-like protein